MRKEQLQRYLRYAQSYIRHGTAAKWLNLFRLEARLGTNNPNLKGLLPYFLFVDISNCCNLKCPLCQMGQGKTIPRDSRMDIDAYTNLMYPLRKKLFQVFMYNWGEPFLNKHIYDMITYNTRNNIGTVVSSNLNKHVDAERLVDSGLGHLIISGDGIVQDVYEKYRVGGNLEKVLENLAAIVDAKKKAKSRFPHIEWQCLVTKYNEPFLDQIRKTALALGANSVRFANLNFYAFSGDEALREEWLPRNPGYRSLAPSQVVSDTTKRKRKPCFWLWRTAIVNSDGGVIPCCLYDIADWGNAFASSFPKVWRNEIFREARERSKTNNTVTKKLVCDRCEAGFIWK